MLKSNNEGILLLKYWPVIVTLIGAIITISSFFYTILSKINENSIKLTQIEQTLNEIKAEVKDDEHWQKEHLDKYHYRPFSANIGCKSIGLSSLGLLYNPK